MKRLYTIAANLVTRKFKEIAMLRKMVILCSFIIGFNVYAAEPDNLSEAINQIQQYHDSGAYDHDLNEAVGEAKRYLAERVKQNAASTNPKKLAIVLDIDETSLTNYPNMKKHGFTQEQTIIDAYVKEGDAPPIKQTLDLYQYAEQNNVAVFFVTGRRQHEEQATVRNLEKIGYKKWDGIYFKPEDYKQRSAAPYKTEIRHMLTEKGYEIVLNIGDQKSDLHGGYVDKPIKLPNPYYYIP